MQTVLSNEIMWRVESNFTGPTSGELQHTVIVTEPETLS